MMNIYDPDVNTKLKEFICASLETHEAARRRRNSDHYITAFERGYAIQKIQLLHENLIKYLLNLRAQRPNTPSPILNQL